MTSHKMLFRLSIAVLASVVLFPVAAHGGVGTQLGIVTVEGLAFEPKRLEVPPGLSVQDYISFTNTTSRTHTVTIPFLGIDQPLVASGSTTIGGQQSAGVYRYFSKPYKSKMRGSIVFKLGVFAPGGTAEFGEILTFSYGFVGAGKNLDIQMRRPGKTTFTTIFGDYIAPNATYRPPAAGTYFFRARTQIGFGAATGWTPAVKVVVT